MQPGSDTFIMSGGTWPPPSEHGPDGFLSSAKKAIEIDRATW